ncbi:GNAT family N-acetyltransferase [Dyella acidiphila]|uniref:GNAT family N-acetyltransferase n=1 Tax=Dyella acidiphila TaxID=2775866 RepID=A0ABR9GCY9_9GAMM|nr:GNAT family N-acetyltransferase [Dyella acidiphila]MBE1161908.1 GNAT family N-acetyltransferase [Dyella acidiphila]
MFTLKPYAPTDALAWDALVRQSRNGNLLHRRGYMDYHADRFVDGSLMIERAGELLAVFPASIKDGVASSHGGLTYAGLISTPALRTEWTLEVLERIGQHYRALGMQRLVYKAVPHVFHSYPAEEDLYALHRLGATLTRRDVSSVVALRAPLPFNDGRRRAVGKARRAGMQIRANGDLQAFHALLSSVLDERYGVAPTHSLEELHLLQSRFPAQIVLYEARREDAMLAGVLVYDFGHAVHTQYLAASEEGRQDNALNLLLAELVEQVYADRQYFSFGISTEREGQVLNGGLITQKEHFGARAVVHDFYEWVL